MEQSGKIDSADKPSVCSGRKEKPNDLTPEWMETSYLMMYRYPKTLECLEDLMRTKNLKILWKRELSCDLRKAPENFESITKGKSQTVSKMVFDRVEQQLCTVEKEWLFTDCRLQYVSPKCLTFFGNS
ncbi:hypothetical protein ElyMa_006539000 [Elysia marginata]|uniref:Uncharacterized protein n=1 Tax=Elysia marginata TaxID=1093978 RepID=A0AAV4I9M2_9GAST|nr:hypothetical protein ElyMa_006539000 [Elysia marginata]